MRLTADTPSITQILPKLESSHDQKNAGVKVDRELRKCCISNENVALAPVFLNNELTEELTDPLLAY